MNGNNHYILNLEVQCSESTVTQTKKCWLSLSQLYSVGNLIFRQLKLNILEIVGCVTNHLVVTGPLKARRGKTRQVYLCTEAIESALYKYKQSALAGD